MKLLVLADAAAWHTERYVGELRNQGHTVYLVSLQTSALVDCQLPPSKYGEAVSYISHIKIIKKLIDEFKPDIINSHFASAYGVMAARCRRRFGDCGATWALTLWGSDILVSPNKSYLHRRRVQYALESADVLFADSTFLRKKTEALTETPVKTILWGVEQKYIATDNTLNDKAERIAPATVLSARNSAPLKLLAPRPHRQLYNNEDLLVSVAQMLKSKQATLTINSTGELFDKFLERAKSLGVGDAITVYQPCDRGEYVALLKQHDFFLSAAVSDSSPVSLIEAMAVGVFPVCASHAGLSDLLYGERISQRVYESSTGARPQEIINSVIALKSSERLTLLKSHRSIVSQIGIYENNISATIEVLAGMYSGQ